MSTTHLLPGPEHPITITPSRQRVRILIGERVVADTHHALALAEADYPVAYYVPRSDVDPDVLADSATVTHCPYKGDASYVDVTTEQGTIRDAAWCYADPYPAVRQIAGHLAWYPTKVTIALD